VSWRFPTVNSAELLSIQLERREAPLSAYLSSAARNEIVVLEVRLAVGYQGSTRYSARIERPFIPPTQYANASYAARLLYEFPEVISPAVNLSAGEPLDGAGQCYWVEGR